jgi:hypothetical protein
VDINRVFPRRSGKRLDFVGAAWHNSTSCPPVEQRPEDAVADSNQYAPLAGEDIDLDRVVMDPRYRRRIIERLRAEAGLRPPSSNEPPPSPFRDD